MTNHIKPYKELLLVLFLLICYPATGVTRYSRGSGSWNSTAIWSATSAGATGASFPVAGDIVYIQTGHAITVPVNSECASITITGSGSSLVVNATFTLSVSGNISLNNLASSSSSFSVSGAGSVICSGNLLVGTTSLNPTGIYTHTFTSSVQSFRVSGNSAINSYCQNKNRVSNGVLSITGGIFTVDGTIITSNEDAAQNIATLTLTTGTLVLRGLTPFSLTLIGVNTITLNGAASSLVNYNGAGAQAVYTTTYSNLTLSGSGVKTLAAPTVSGILSMEETATTAGTSPVYGASATLQYKGAGLQTTGIEFPATFSGTGGVNIENASGVSLDASRIIACTLNLTAGALSIGAGTLTLQTSNILLSRTSGTITTTSSSNLSFGSVGNTGGNGFSIPAGLFTSNPAYLNNLSIYRTNQLALGDQMLSVSGIVLCNGPLVTNGNLTLISTPAGTGLIDGSGTGSITGNVTMQRYLATGGYKYFSSPFTNATVDDFSPPVDLAATFPTLYRYDEADLTTSGWVNHTTAGSSLANLEGYAVNFGSLASTSTVDLTGTVNNGPYTRSINNNNGLYTQGFNLVGNPYPSPIDWDAAAGWTKTNLDAALYFFKAEGADQYSGTYYYYVSPAVKTGDASNIIPSMQGFFVHVTNIGAGSIGLNNSVRVTDLTHTFIKKSAGEKQGPQLLKVTAAYSDYPDSDDPAVIYFHEKGTWGFDSQLDAYKLINTDVLTPNLYIVAADDKLAINALPENDDSLTVIPLGLKTDRDGLVSFSVPESNLKAGRIIYLHDNVTGTDRILDSSKKYTVKLPAGEYDDRFSVHFVVKEKNIPENWPGQDLLNAYVSNGKLIADISMLSGNRGTLLVSSLSGNVVFRKDIYSLGYHEFNIKASPGLYVITYITGKFRAAKKISIFDQ